MKVLILLCLLCVSCADPYIDVSLDSPQEIQKDNFYMSTSELALESYEVLTEIDLYEIIPDLDSWPLEKESFWDLQDILEDETKFIKSNYIIITEGNDCTSMIGYCKALVLDRMLN